MGKAKFASPTLKLDFSDGAQWDEAKEASSGGCLIADAIKKQYPQFTSISVDMATIRVSDRKKGMRYTYLTPEAAQMMLLSYDQGWSQPEEHTITIRRAVRTTAIVRHRKNAERRAERLAELEEKEQAGTLTASEKAALTTMRSAPERPTSGGKSEMSTSTSNRKTIHGGRNPRQVKNPNLLRGRDRVFGAKVSQPSKPWQDALDQAKHEWLAEMTPAPTED